VCSQKQNSSGIDFTRRLSRVLGASSPFLFVTLAWVHEPFSQGEGGVRHLPSNQVPMEEAVASCRSWSSPLIGRGGERSAKGAPAALHCVHKGSLTRGQTQKRAAHLSREASGSEKDSGCSQVQPVACERSEQSTEVPHFAGVDGTQIQAKCIALAMIR